MLLLYEYVDCINLVWIGMMLCEQAPTIIPIHTSRCDILIQQIRQSQ
ncbi:MAG: hypothetical protein J6U82_04680 [Alistipes sp.]|nr:hypothetical protein [Alistipes sp.]